MNMPAQVARAAELADARQKELLNQSAEDNSPGETPPPATEPPAPAPAPAATDEAAELRKQLDAAEHRYRTLQGMYNSDRQRAQDQMTQMQQRLADLERATQQPAKPSGPVSEQDAEKFDQETIDFVVRVATNVATSVASDLVNNALAQRLEPVQQTVANVATQVQQTAQERYYASLDAAQPDWRDINVSSQFIQWLQNVDPMSGYPINTLLQDAHQSMNVDRVSAIFAAFKAATGAPAPARAPVRAPVDERASLVEPPRGGASTPAQRGGNAKTYTRADIAQFYRDVTAGRIDRAHAATMEQDILKAQSEGRIVG